MAGEGPTHSFSSTWAKIEVSESYLVSCMFEDAASLASSIVRCLRDTTSTKALESVQFDDMMESACMVFVQSLKELGRTSELFNELRALFGSLTAIPAQVILTGACFQISEGCSSDLTVVLEEFLNGWKYVDGQSYVHTSAEVQRITSTGPIECSALGIEKYLEFAEVYAVILLGKVLGDAESAVAWVEKADMPEESRQEMIRRLRSLCSLKNSRSSLCPGTPEIEEKSGKQTTSGSGGSSRASEAQKLQYGDNAKPILNAAQHHRLSKHVEPCFWWFRTFTLKIGDVNLVVSRGRAVLWSAFALTIVYLLRRKVTVLKRIVRGNAASAKKAIIDAWQLAFSVQVNPLAAIQQLPAATHSNGR